jgi:hypothetical protein
MPKSDPFGCFWPPDLRHLMSIFLDETWHTPSLRQNLDPTFLFGHKTLWSHLEGVLKRQLGPQILSY